MTPKQYHEANIRLQILKTQIATLLIGSKPYNDKMREIKRLDDIIKLHDVAFKSICTKPN